MIAAFARLGKSKLFGRLGAKIPQFGHSLSLLAPDWDATNKYCLQ